MWASSMVHFYPNSSPHYAYLICYSPRLPPFPSLFVNFRQRTEWLHIRTTPTTTRTILMLFPRIPTRIPTNPTFIWTKSISIPSFNPNNKDFFIWSQTGAYIFMIKVVKIIKFLNGSHTMYRFFGEVIPSKYFTQN